ncbi:hypothetical protein [Nocardioides daejeonensis]|uniref:hypothetical protein n=1 Tax=Nocardioides daejeonensis TaxID=1046556 RepID=UPI000D740F43|nr:hypothetical protein [Nocardioides daejeonensis]
MSRVVRLLAVVLALGLVGCSDDPQPKDTVIEGLTQEEFGPQVRNATLAAETAALAFAAMGRHATGQVRFGSERALHIASGNGLARSEIVIVGEAGYRRKGYAKFDPMGADEVKSVAEAMPSAILMRLLDAGADEIERFRHVGEDWIGQTRFQRYDLVYQRSFVAKALELQEKRTPLMSFRYWLDDELRVRRLAFTMAGEESVLDLTAWGDPVSLAEPAASEIYGMTAGEKPGTGAYVPLTRVELPDRMNAAYGRERTVHTVMAINGETTMDADMQFNEIGDLVAVRGELSEGGDAYEMVYVDGAAYFRFEGERKYVALTGADAERLVDEMSKSNPRELAAMLRESSKAVDYRGVETIDGAKFHRYDLSIDPKWLVEQGGVKPGVAEEVATFTYRLFLDDLHRLRRMTLDADGQSMQADLTAWGKPASIEAPSGKELQSRRRT